jgi:hypothetical protein
MMFSVSPSPSTQWPSRGMARHSPGVAMGTVSWEPETGTRSRGASCVPYRLHSLSYPLDTPDRSPEAATTPTLLLLPSLTHAPGLSRTNAALPRRVHGPVVTAAAAGGGHTLLLSDKGQLFAVGRWVASPSPAYRLPPPPPVRSIVFQCLTPRSTASLQTLVPPLPP